MLIEKEDFPLKERYTLEELRDLMAFLRSEQGCPWDRQQTHDSIKKNMLEEAYEAIDAIDSEDPKRICDELGDVLMQVVFHAQIAAEKSEFNLDDVISGICRKLISRHTHIFASDHGGSAEEVLDLWEENKKKEKGLKRQSQVLEDVPRTLPALQRSYKVQQKAAKVGFDWDSAAGPLAKIFEELDEIKAIYEATQKELTQKTITRAQANRAVADEFGDFLFAAVNLARHLQVQPEMALTKGTQKFIRRFTAVEELAIEQDLKLEELDLVQLDQLWEQIKKEQG